MKKLIISGICFVSFSYSCSAQTTLEKIAGNWILNAKNGNKIVRSEEWSFTSNGQGSKTTRSNAPKLSCSSTMYFSFTISGDSIHVVPSKEKSRCADLTRGENIYDEKINETVTQPPAYSMLIRLNGLKNLLLAGQNFSKE